MESRPLNFPVRRRIKYEKAAYLVMVLKKSASRLWKRTVASWKENQASWKENQASRQLIRRSKRGILEEDIAKALENYTKAAIDQMSKGHKLQSPEFSEKSSNVLTKLVTKVALDRTGVVDNDTRENILEIMKNIRSRQNILDTYKSKPKPDLVLNFQHKLLVGELGGVRQATKFLKRFVAAQEDISKILLGLEAEAK